MLHISFFKVRSNLGDVAECYMNLLSDFHLEEHFVEKQFQNLLTQ